MTELEIVQRVERVLSSSREELNRFITSVNSFHPALKYKNLKSKFQKLRWLF